MTESAYTDSLNELIKQFDTLPGIGTKTAERLAMHILNCDNDEAIALADEGKRIAAEGAKARYPAFDVTPADLITAIITDKGVVQPPSTEGIAKLFD